MTKASLLDKELAAASRHLSGRPKAYERLKRRFSDAWLSTLHAFRVAGQIVRRYPSTAILPLTVLAVLLGLGVWGVTVLSQRDENSSQDNAKSIARDTAVEFSSQFTQSYLPIMSLTALVQYSPQYDVISKIFAAVAPSLLAQVPKASLRSIQLAPNGIIKLVEPLKGNEGALNLNLFNSTLERATVLKTVRDGVLTMAGPLTFKQGGFGVRIRMPVTVAGVDANDTFGGPPGPYECGDICYNAPTRTKFWGFATALIDLDVLAKGNDSRLASLITQGYVFRLAARPPSPGGNWTYIAGAKEPLQGRPQEAVIRVPNGEWVLSIDKEGGWTPDWYIPALVLVIVASVAISVLIFAVLVSRRQHQMLLEALLPKKLLHALRNKDSVENLGKEGLFSTDTPADTILHMMGGLLEGRMPDVRDVVLVRTAIRENYDIYQPLDLGQQFREANMDDEVARALMRQLGHHLSDELDEETQELANQLDDAEHELAGRSGSGDDDGGDMHAVLSAETFEGCQTLGGALSLLMTPLPAVWTAGGGDPHNDAMSDASVPVAGADLIVSHLVNPSGPSMQISRRCSLEASLAVQQQQQLGAGAGGGGGAPGTPPMVVPGQEVVLPAGVALGALRTASKSVSMAGGLPASSPLLHTLGSRDRVSSAGGGGTGGGGLPSSPLAHIGRGLKSPFKGAVGQLSLLGNGGVSMHGGGTPSLLRGGTGSGMVVPLNTGGSAAVAAAAAAGLISSGTLPSNGTGEAVSETLNSITLPGGWPHQMALQEAARQSPACSRKAVRYQQAAAALPPPQAIVDEVERLLAGADGWHFDTFRLEEATQGHALSCLAFYLIQRANLVRRFSINPLLLARCLRHFEAGYISENKYHNATHAADVLHTLHCVIHQAQLHVHYLDPLGLLASYLAAVVHDYGHLGLTNDYLVASSAPLAVRYNDRSPMENHHCAAAFSALHRPELNWLEGLSAQEQGALRKQVIEMVMSTDMKQHFATLSHFNTVHRISTTTAPAAAASLVTARMHSKITPADVEAGTALLLSEAPKPKDETERLLSLQVALKCSDLGHLAAPLPLHLQWVMRLEEEYFLQGDKEREAGMAISPLFDRQKQGISKSQVGFFDFVVLPQMHAMASAFPGVQPMLGNVLANYNYWKSEEGKKKEAPK